jgi:SecD/SecF fusion protein
MRNKGFFWFLTIVLTAVCIYQLSFTLVASNVEEDAAKEAVVRAEELKKKTFEMDSTWATLPNDSRVDFSKPESFEIAKAAFLNEVLAERAEEEVYPIIGSNFQSVKKRSLAFGLDLVGGMSVTVEISVPDFVKSFARNQQDLVFKKPFDKAYAIHTNKGGDFISLFIGEFEKAYPNRLLVRELDITEVKELKTTSSNADVETFFRDKLAGSMDGVEQIMYQRINQFGVAQPNIQRDARMNRLFIELPGVQDEKTVAAKIQTTANLEFFETYNIEEIQGVLLKANEMSRSVEVKAPEIDSAAIGVTDSTELARLDSINKAKIASKPLVAPKSNQKELFKLLVANPQGAVIGYATTENKNQVNRILAREDIKAMIFQTFPDLKFMWSAKAEKEGNQKEMTFALHAIRIPIDGKAQVGGSDISEAYVSRNQENQQTTVNLRMTNEGQGKWFEMTSKNIKRSVAITMDGVVYSAPTVQSAIDQGNTEITGNFTIEQAQDLVGILNGGALPAPCIIKDQTKVGPTIGAENSQAGLISFALAFLAVFIYMYFYYGKAGLVANIALFVNVILIFGALASFGAVLTLAGIAGIVLTIGTAVDANILIFERIREEQARGLDLASSTSVGFSKALPSIIDANVTHLLVAIILKVFGTGEIESFATTLIIGIFTSLFSSIVISKLIITSSIEKGKDVTFNTKFSKGLFQNFHFDWVGKRKYFYMFSIAITILGAVALMTRGLKQSVEFTGGRSYVAKFEKKADIEFIRGELSKVFVEKNGEISSIDLKTKSNDYNVEITTNYLLAVDSATAEVTDKLKQGLDNCKAKMGGYEITESRSISASVSNELWKSSAIAIVLALIAIFAYILIRFGQWQYSLGAIVSLAHDAMVVLSVFALLHGFLPFSLDVNQAFIAAILTVIGYSMNDTVIVYDRIRENLNMNKDTDDHGAIINKSLNTTLSRTFNTSMILFVVLLVMFIFGGPAIKGFLFALLVGVVIGTYSSLCVATPILIDFNKRFIVKKK